MKKTVRLTFEAVYEIEALDQESIDQLETEISTEFDMDTMQRKGTIGIVNRLWYDKRLSNSENVKQETKLASRS